MRRSRLLQALNARKHAIHLTRHALEIVDKDSSSNRTIVAAWRHAADAWEVASDAYEEAGEEFEAADMRHIAKEARHFDGHGELALLWGRN